MLKTRQFTEVRTSALEVVEDGLVARFGSAARSEVVQLATIVAASRDEEIEELEAV